MTPQLLRFGRFAIVGSVGFLVDSSVLWIGIHMAGLGLFVGRIVSFMTSATITWYLNRTFTYRDRASDNRQSDQWLIYLVVSIVGAVVNYGTYCAVVVSSGLAAHYPVLAVAAGSVAGMLVNFFAYSKFVFRAMPVGAHR